MTKVQDLENQALSRREALGRVAGAGLGILSVLRGGFGSVQLLAQGAAASTPANPRPNPNFPMVPSWNTELRPLAPNVYAYIQAGGPGIVNAGISNAGVIVGDDHWLAIDALGAPLQTKAFIAAARQATGKPCGRLVNTHHHGDHVTGNQFFLPAEIVSHEYCRQEVAKMAAAVPAGSKFDRREGYADGTEDRKVAVPITTFNDRVTYYYGNTRVEFISIGPAHTWGDVMAYLPQYRILFAGDVFFNYVVPFGQNAHITKWLEAVDTINKMDVETIVPGHGPIGNKKELADMAQYYVILRREVRKRFDAGMTPGRAIADITMGKYDNWIGPEQIIRNVVRLYAEFNGTLVPDILTDANRIATEEYNAIKAGKR